MKLLFLAAAIGFSVSTLAQTNVTTVKLEFYVKNSQGVKIVICKLFEKIDLLTNDTTSFVKMQLKDEIKSGNNGYIFLSNQDEVNGFTNYLDIAISKFNINNTFESPAGKYKIEVSNVMVKKKGTFKLNICETLGGNARVSLTAQEATSLSDWLKSIELSL